MLKKIIAAGIAAMLANASMIYASNSQVVTKADDFPAEVEETVVLADTSAEATTATVAASPAEEGAAIREDLNVKVGDVVVFESEIPLLYADGREVTVKIREPVWIIGADDENQQFRIYVPRLCDPSEESVLYLWYQFVGFATKRDNYSGYMVGDVYSDQQIDVFDLGALKGGLIQKGWPYKYQKFLADIDADGEVTVLDLVILLHWVHGIPDKPEVAE